MNIQNIGGHPYKFYEKTGYKIVGVFPDANGVGKPDIWMAKRVGLRKVQNYIHFKTSVILTPSSVFSA